MKRLGLALMMLLALPAMAGAATMMVATGNVNLRAGPSTAYPVVTVVPAGAQVQTHGCLAGITWCDISLGPFRGWVAAPYVQVVYRGAPVVLTPVVAPAVGVAVVSFNRAYWDRYYVAYPWYGSWARYAPPPYRPGRVTTYDRAVTCAGGACTATRSATGVYGGSASQTRTCANGTCTANRNVTGPAGNTASRSRTCSRADQSCDVTRVGPHGGTATRSFGR